MISSAAISGSWVVRHGRELVARVGQLEVLDRAYTLAAGTFVALIPLILVLTALVTRSGSESPVATELIERFGLVGAAAQTTRELIVVRQEGIYWLGLVITLYSAMVLGRRASRTYNAIWKTPPLSASQQWRSLLWVVIQVAMVVSVTQLRDVLRDSGPVAAALLGVTVVVVWAAAEYLCQWLFTQGRVAGYRLLTAAIMVSLGRIGIVVWSSVFLSASLTRQALSYGPIGVVFSLFSALLATWLVMLGATLLAAVITDGDLDLGDPGSPADGSRQPLLHSPGAA